ncbi:MAG: BON domain-containing protein [Mariniblastus sp.]|nr:BON domain-containing protein [Mariniblastus sp.]
MSFATLLAFENDARVARRVKVSLQGLGYPQLSALTCESEGSTVVIKGELGSYYLAQLAQTIAAKVPGVRRVINQVNVCLSR